MPHIPKAFWSEEAKEPAHKRIKNALLSAGETPQPKKAHHSKKAKAKIFKGKSQKSSKVKSFIEKRMHEFKEGKMHSRVKKTGPKVTNPKQAIAISLSEAREKGARVKRKSK